MCGTARSCRETPLPSQQQPGVDGEAECCYRARPTNATALRVTGLSAAVGGEEPDCDVRWMLPAAQQGSYRGGGVTAKTHHKVIMMTAREKQESRPSHKHDDEASEVVTAPHRPSQEGDDRCP